MNELRNLLHEKIARLLYETLGNVSWQDAFQIAVRMLEQKDAVNFIYDSYEKNSK